MSCINYAALSVTDRIKTAYDQMMAAGVKKGKAITLLAISQNEVDWIWNQPRASDLYFGPLGCDNCRVVIGWEYGLKEGKRTVREPPSNPQHLAHLVDRGILLPDGSPGSKLSSNLGWARTYWFEYTVATRDAKSLGNFSIGPTMMFLLYQWPGNFGSSWDKLWEFYTANDAGIIANGAKMYDAWGTWPADAPDDKALAVKWLSKQTGAFNQSNGKTAAENYYDGGGPGGYKSFKKGMDLVFSLVGG